MTRALLLVALLAGCGSRGPAGPPPAGAPVDPGLAPGAPPPGPRAEVRIGTAVVVRAPGAGDKAAEILEVELPSERTGIGVGLSRRHVPTMPVVTGGPVSASVGLDPAIIRRVIRKHTANLQRCYQLHTPAVPAKVDVRFTIDGSGRVAVAGATGLPAVVTRCLEQEMRAMQFPAPQGGASVTVSYPFLFQPGPGGVLSGPPPPPSGPTRVAERLDPDLPPRPLCASIDPPPALRAALPALSACYREALGRVPGLAGILVIRTGSAPELAGVDEPGLRECVSRQLAGLPGPDQGDLAVSLGFATDRVADGLAEITLGADSVHLGAQIRGRKLRDWHMASGRGAALIDTIAAEVGAPARVLLRGQDQAPGQGMARAAERLRQAGIDVVVARRQEDGWQPLAVAPAVVPWRTVCPRGIDADVDRERAVSVVVTGEGIWVGSREGRAHLVRQRGELDTIGYARVLRDLKRGPLAGRADAEIAAARDVSWVDLARAVDILHDTGFFELILVAVAEDDPRQQ